VFVESHTRPNGIVLAHFALVKDLIRYLIKLKFKYPAPQYTQADADASADRQKFI
jgi:hypothetical protein